MTDRRASLLQRPHSGLGKKKRTLSIVRGCGNLRPVARYLPYSNSLSVVPVAGGPPFRFASGVGGATGAEGGFC